MSSVVIPFARGIETDTSRPRYTTGHAINIGMLALALLLIAVNIVYCKWENKKRANGKRDYRLAEEREEMLGYRHPSFEYTI